MIQEPREPVDYYRFMDASAYAARINTPAKHPEYFRRFNLPMVEQAKRKFDAPIRALDVACGPAYELEFFLEDGSLELWGTDISPKIIAECHDRLGDRVHFFVSDAANDVPDEIFEVGLLVNAVVYSPGEMLANMHRVLRPGGQCSVNFRIFGNPHNQAFYEYYEKRGGKIIDEELEVRIAGGVEVFNIKVLDYNQLLDDSGQPDHVMRQLDRQVYFQSAADASHLVHLSGFKTVRHDLFNFGSPANPNNQIDVFVLEK